MLHKKDSLLIAMNESTLMPNLDFQLLGFQDITGIFVEKVHEKMRHHSQ